MTDDLKEPRADEELEPRNAAEMAGNFGAGLYVLGEIIEAGEQLRIDATLYRTDTAEAMAEASAEGAADEVFTLVDEIAAGILGNMDGAPGARVETLPIDNPLWRFYRLTP